MIQSENPINVPLAADRRCKNGVRNLAVNTEPFLLLLRLVTNVASAR